MSKLKTRLTGESNRSLPNDHSVEVALGKTAEVEDAALLSEGAAAEKAQCDKLIKEYKAGESGVMDYFSIHPSTHPPIHPSCQR